MSFVPFDGDEALAIRRDNDAVDATHFGGREEQSLCSAIAGDTNDRTIGQANCEAGAIGQCRYTCSRERYAAYALVRRVGEPYGRTFIGDRDRIAVRRYSDPG